MNIKNFPDEINYFNKINQKLDDSLYKVKSDFDKINKEYMEQKLYMVKYRGEIDPHEMLQNEQALNRINNLGEFVSNTLNRISKLKDSPYFASINFKEKDSKEIEKYYIGRFSFSYENELFILDWRAPAASMFYDCEIGLARYNSPSGMIEGNLTCKRQFKIKNGKIKYIFESSVNIQDNVLQMELSQASDEKMKSIISTIQNEQNQIIRNEKTEILLIQGVAGSGKTSIALHRIAFLLYKFKDKLSSKNIMIISLNKVFGNYISNVLPELGEEPIYELSFYDIAEIQLKGIIQFEHNIDFLEIEDKNLSERIKFKSTFDFVKMLDCYLKNMPNLIFKPTDYIFGRFTAKADFIKSRFEAYSKYPVKQRLKRIAEDIYDRFETENFMEEQVPKVGTILKNINSMIKIKNTLALYKDFYKEMGILNMFLMPSKNIIEWSDVYPFLYFYAAFEGLKEDKIIKHIVIDEMQDYSPIQYAVLNILFKCKKQFWETLDNR